MIDAQVYLGRWPFRRLPLDEPRRLEARLRALGVTAAWAGSFDALLHEDISAVNARLAEACRDGGAGFFVPFGAVNPRLPDWREDLRRCHEVHRMPGIRLHPSYHQYTLDDPRLAELLAEADRRGLRVQIALKMEDQRTRHPALRETSVDAGPLAAAGRPARPRVMLLNAFAELRGPALPRIAGGEGRAVVDLATLEGAGGLASLIAEIGHESILFGSLAPLFLPESAVLKLRESALTAPQHEAITRRNAEGWLEAG